MEPSEPPTAALYLAVLSLLLLCSMFFSASETAILSASRLHIRYLREKKNRAAIRVERLLSRKALFLNAILVGNNVVNVTMSAIVTALSVERFGAAGVALATVIATVGILVFGEILPKSIALLQSERIALALSLPLSALIAVAAPFVSVLTLVTSFLSRVIGGGKGRESDAVTEDDIKALIEVGEEEGLLGTGERVMLHNIINYTDLNARDIMTPRTDIVALPLQATREDVLSASRDSSLSRFPVYGDDIDDVRGFLYVKDFLFPPAGGGKRRIADMLRPALFVFESRKISELQKLFRAENQNIAIVLDEYGGTSGLVSTQDLVEEIFGRVRDEYDAVAKAADESDSAPVAALPLDLDGSERLDAVSARLGASLSSEFYDTIAGFVMERLDDIPSTGSSVREQGYAFTVTAMTGNRVDSVRVSRTGGHP